MYIDVSPSPGPGILCEDDDVVEVEVVAPRPAGFWYIFGPFGAVSILGFIMVSYK